MRGREEGTFLCPGCKKPMVERGRRHVLFTDGEFKVTYRCEMCDTEIVRTLIETANS
jgi:ribosomal protein L37AE/L43A